MNSPEESPTLLNASPPRVTSIDALRGVVMFTMIFVNDIDRESTPWWMRHYAYIGKNGMTFVDMVFPAFLFIVGMSIPMATISRLSKGQPLWKILGHIILRTLSLLLIGIMMVNDESAPSKAQMGFSGTLWTAAMFLASVFAFCDISSPRKSSPPAQKNFALTIINWTIRFLAFAALFYLALAYRNHDGRRILTLRPFSIRTDWYGILGLIGWAYLVASIVFLFFRTHRTALLGCTALLLCLYSADQKGLFEHFFLHNCVGVGGTLGALGSISVAGIPLVSILYSSMSVGARARFTLLYIAGFSAAAILLAREWGISKNDATPGWCLWACAITATLWLIFYFIADVWQIKFISKPLAIAGQNVLLAYLLSEMMGSVLELIHLDNWYDRLAEPNLTHAIARSAGVGVVILILTALLNRVGFRLKL